jgi:hypothetical protein
VPEASALQRRASAACQSQSKSFDPLPLILPPSFEPFVKVRLIITFREFAAWDRVAQKLAKRLPTVLDVIFQKSVFWYNAADEVIMLLETLSSILLKSFAEDSENVAEYGAAKSKMGSVSVPWIVFRMRLAGT